MSDDRPRVSSCLRSRAWTAAALLACAWAPGCQLAYFLSPEHTKPVRAEYSKIGRQKVAVLVWADRAILDVAPRARERICKAVTYYLRKNLPDARFVGPRLITKLQERSGLNWESMSIQALCKRLECDLLLRVDLLDYTTRATDTHELRKGRVRATINLYQDGSDGGEDPVYETEVVASFPPASAHGIIDMSDRDILHETVEQFGQITARKFYDHEVSYRGPAGR